MNILDVHAICGNLHFCAAVGTSYMYLIGSELESFDSHGIFSKKVCCHFEDDFESSVRFVRSSRMTNRPTLAARHFSSEARLLLSCPVP